jgi:eukaryotic-like serine/threonine-protein kinase
VTCSPMTLNARTGEILGGHYELIAQIGEGGQSVVYRARDTAGGPDVAVKVLRERVAADPVARERMNREALALMNLAHTRAGLRIHGMYWTEDGALSLVTELLNGLDLDDVLKRRGGQLEPAELISVLDPVVETLAQAHSQGIVHRDLKPGNIFVVSEPPGVRLLDFGFAKFTRLRSFTMDGSVAGSPKFIAPEAWLGRRDLDPRVDVYALGALIFRCLAGRSPFEQETLLHLLAAVTKDPRPSLWELRPDLPPALDDWVQLALAIEREKRFQNVEALWAAFTGIVR